MAKIIFTAEMRAEVIRLTGNLVEGMADRLDVTVLSDSLSHEEFALIREQRRIDCNALCMSLLNAKSSEARVKTCANSEVILLVLVMDRIKAAFFGETRMRDRYHSIEIPDDLTLRQVVMSSYLQLGAGVFHVA